MSYEATIKNVRCAITAAFDELDTWFGQPRLICAYKPSGGGWSIHEILEHVSLTSHFLLIVIRNGTAKALKRSSQRGLPSSGESNLEVLAVIGTRGSFAWARPEHMVPSGNKNMTEVRNTLRLQRDECLAILNKLSNGEGSLFTANMSVARIGRMDLYQWIFFLAEHARRHVSQINAVYQEAKAQN